jgi:poly(hydroxyalkanoate) depolymerase family esterase
MCLGALFGVLSHLSAWLCPGVAVAGEFLEGKHAGYAYKLYVPGTPNTGTRLPLLVLLHGCMQDPARIAANTRMNEHAERHRFLVLYPNQGGRLNLRCWHWFDPDHQERGRGEPAVIAGMVGALQQRYSVDPRRVYVAGISAGAVMSVAMATLYPDLFAAVGASAGLGFRPAAGIWEGMRVMRSGVADPVSQGKVAYEAMGDYARVVPLILFHGSQDPFVALSNSEQLVESWTQAADLAADHGVDDDDVDAIPERSDAGRVPEGRSYTHYIYTDKSGRVVVERYVVQGMRHAWSGGAPKPWFGMLQDRFADPKGPDASRLLLEFFHRHPMPAAPGGGATAAGG